MQKLSSKKAIAIVVFLALTVTYFWPEISTALKDIRYYAPNVISQNKNLISVGSPFNTGYALPAKPVIVFVTELPIEKIDRANSYIEIYGDFKERYRYDLNSKNVSISNTDEGTLIRLHHIIELPEDRVVYIEVYLNDSRGNTSFAWIWACTSNDFLLFFVARFSYYLQYIIWYFAIFGGLVRSLNWSTVYNSVTKKPVANAIVRIYKDGRLYLTLISDVNGIIKTTLVSGIYKFVVIKPGYHFPSNLYPLRVDRGFRNLYYGEEIHISKKSEEVYVCIPLDPDDKSITLSPLSRSYSEAYSTLFLLNPFLSVVFAIAQIIIWPDNLIGWTALLISLAIIALQRYFRNRTKLRRGKVNDSLGKPVEGIRIDLYEAEWNKFVDSTITNSKGEYEFVLPAKNYYLIIDNPEYRLVGEDSEGKYYISPSKIDDKVVVVNSELIVEKTERAADKIPPASEIVRNTDAENPSIESSAPVISNTPQSPVS